MKKLVAIILIFLLLTSCDNPKKDVEDLQKETVENILNIIFNISYDIDNAGVTSKLNELESLLTQSELKSFKKNRKHTYLLARLEIIEGSIEIADILVDIREYENSFVGYFTVTVKLITKSNPDKIYELIQEGSTSLILGDDGNWKINGYKLDGDMFKKYYDDLK